MLEVWRPSDCNQLSRLIPCRNALPAVLFSCLTNAKLTVEMQGGMAGRTFPRTQIPLRAFCGLCHGVKPGQRLLAKYLDETPRR